MIFHMRSEFERHLLRDFRHRNDAVRVADGSARDLELLISHPQGFVNHLTPIAANRDFIADEGYGPHIDLDSPRLIVQNLDRDFSAERLESESIVFNVGFVKEVLGKYADAVAALFRLAAIGIENFQRDLSAIKQRSIKNPVRSDAEVSVADTLDICLCQTNFVFARIDDDVVVAECMIFVEIHRK